MLGLTVTSGAGLSGNGANSQVAYSAGCTVVLWKPRERSQRFLVSKEKRPLTCVSFSRDGQLLATGESGHAPMVRVWEVEKEAVVAELAEHKFGIASLAFSPDRASLVSVGDQHDMTIVVWDWRARKKLASARLSFQVHAMSFSESGSYFVTAGAKHVKFWRQQAQDSRRPTTGKAVLSLSGRNAILNSFRNNVFCALVCGRGHGRDGIVSLADRAFALVQSGTLCEIDAGRRSINRWIDLNEESARDKSKANALSLASGILYVGCDRGVVYLFDAASMAYLHRLPLPHYLGVDLPAVQTPEDLKHHPPGSLYPDTLALVHSESAGERRTLTVVYSDHSVYTWDVHDIHRIGKVVSNLYHAGLVFGVEAFPAHRSGLLPPGTFATCASDHTIRLWHLDRELPVSAAEGAIGRGLYSEDALKILYTQPEDLSTLTDIDVNSGGSLEFQRASSGIRALCFSPDGSHLASGDRNGDIRVHDLRSCEVAFASGAHDKDVMSIAFSDPPLADNPNSPLLMATASRDTAVHLFDAADGFRPLKTVAEHSSTVTATRLVSAGQDGLKLLTASSDKSLIFRSVTRLHNGELELARVGNLALQSALYDLELDPEQKTAYAACYDHQVPIGACLVTNLGGKRRAV